MATHSTIPAVRTAFADAMTANGAVGGAGVQVSRGYPGESFIERESVYVDRITGAHAIANIKAGRKQRDETYKLVVVVSVAEDIGTVADVEDRAFELLAEVEDWLADDPSLGDVDGVVFATAGEFELFSDMTANGVACVIRFDIDVTARLI